MADLFFEWIVVNDPRDGRPTLAVQFTYHPDLKDQVRGCGLYWHPGPPKYWYFKAGSSYQNRRNAVQQASSFARDRGYAIMGLQTPAVLTRLFKPMTRDSSAEARRGLVAAATQFLQDTCGANALAEDIGALLIPEPQLMVTGVDMAVAERTVSAGALLRRLPSGAVFPVTVEETPPPRAVWPTGVPGQPTLTDAEREIMAGARRPRNIATVVHAPPDGPNIAEMDAALRAVIATDVVVSTTVSPGNTPAQLRANVERALRTQVRREQEEAAARARQADVERRQRQAQEQQQQRAQAQQIAAHEHREQLRAPRVVVSTTKPSRLLFGERLLEVTPAMWQAFIDHHSCVLARNSFMVELVNKWRALCKVRATHATAGDMVRRLGGYPTKEDYSAVALMRDTSGPVAAEDTLLELELEYSTLAGALGANGQEAQQHAARGGCRICRPLLAP